MPALGDRSISQYLMRHAFSAAHFQGTIATSGFYPRLNSSESSS